MMGCLPNNPLAVIRSISDTSERGPVLGGARALGSLLRGAPAARTLGTRLR